VGDDVNTVLLDSIAQENRGASDYVRPGEDIGQTVSGFYEKVSTPVLTDISLDFGDIEVLDVYPQPLPDLFAGSQLVVVGRYRGEGTVTLGLSGAVNGEEQTFSYAGQVFPAHGSGTGIGMVAARILADAVKGKADPGSLEATWAYQAAFQREYGGLLASYDVFRRLSQSLSEGEVETLLASGLLTENSCRAGLVEEMPRLSPSDLLKDQLSVVAHEYLAVRDRIKQGNAPHPVDGQERRVIQIQDRRKETVQ
jgi:hypothetical protein